jgi:hypothetical protein
MICISIAQSERMNLGIRDVDDGSAAFEMRQGELCDSKVLK